LGAAIIGPGMRSAYGRQVLSAPPKDSVPAALTSAAQPSVAARGSHEIFMNADSAHSLRIEVPGSYFCECVAYGDQLDHMPLDKTVWQDKR
jgi:hypothetical protein